MEHSAKTIYGIIELLKQKELLKCICNIEEEITVSDITYFSGSASAGSLFICKGAGFKEAYLREAADNGIACYM